MAGPEALTASVQQISSNDCVLTLEYRLDNDQTVSDALVALFGGSLSGNVSDAMETLGLRRSVITGYKLIAPEGTAIVGLAFTVRQQRKHGSDDRAVNLTNHIAVSRDLAKAGEIVVIDTGGITDVATWGELHSARCLRRGVAGMITNGATRDAESIRRMRFPVFCQALSPVKSQWDIETQSLNQPVTLNSVQIRTGDIIVADETGIIVVPIKHAREVAKMATQIRVAEEEALLKG
jgi:regulator of RNase E activity RraA